MRRKFTVILLIMSLLLSLTIVVGAKNNNKGMSDEEFIKLQDNIFSKVKEMRQKGSNDLEVEKFLKKNGVTVASKERKYINMKTGEEIPLGEVSGQYLDPQYVTIDVWSTYYDRDMRRWTVLASQQRAAGPLNLGYWGEEYPASYDVLSLNWNDNVFSYVSADSGDSYIWLADASQRDRGTVIFSVKDNYSTTSNNGYISTYVGLYAKQDGTYTTVATRYTHTYLTSTRTTSYTGNASWVWGSNLTVGVSYTVINTSEQASWNKSDTYGLTTKF